jgi:hypothetical protein
MGYTQERCISMNLFIPLGGSVIMTDYWDPDGLTLSAYDANEGLIGSFTINTQDAYASLDVNGQWTDYEYFVGIYSDEAIHSLDLSSKIGSVYWDDLKYSTSSVPIPSSILLLVSGLIGAIGLKRRNKT